MKNDSHIVAEWIEDNYPLIMDIYIPLAQHEYSLLMSYDDVFRDTIRDEFREIFYRLLCIEFTRATGLSTETFYAVFDDELMNKMIYRLEDIKEIQ